MHLSNDVNLIPKISFVWLLSTLYTPTYYSYSLSDHKVSFGFDQTTRNCFSSIVLEFNN